jgi:phage-related tail fiber protein
MFIDGIQVVEGSSVSNLTVDSGASFPASGSLGELFYYTGAEAGLYIYSNSGWSQVAQTDAVSESIMNAIAGIDLKESVKAATTGPVFLTGEQTVDGVALVAGQRVLVKDQVDASENGIYIVAAGAWPRSIDTDGTPAAEVSTGLYAFVEEGATNGNSGWILVTQGTITVGTTALTFAKFTGTGGITAGQGLVKNGDTLYVASANSSNIVIHEDSIDLAATGVVAGNYTKVTVDAFGRVSTGSSPTTLAGYGITDAQALDADLTAIAALTGTSGVLRKTAANTWTLDTSDQATTDQNIAFSGDVTGTGTIGSGITLTLSASGASAGTYRSVTVDAKGRVTAGTNPTTLTGYGITDAQPLDGDLTAIAGLAGTAGFLKKTAVNSWSLDTSTYLTGNQTVTISGDATGSGATSIALTLANSGVSAGTYRSVTVDAKGRVTAGTNPTTLAGYGITDAASLSGSSTQAF